MEIKKIKPLSTTEMEKIYGGTEEFDKAEETNTGRCRTGQDDIDCSSEGASGGSTTDTE